MNNSELIEEVLNMDLSEIEKQYEYLGEGASRIVFGIDENYVIKVPKDRVGRLQSKIENRVYTSLSEDLRKYLCPLICYENNRIIMRRALPLNHIIKNRDLTIYDILGIRRRNTFYRDIKKIVNSFDLLYEDVLSVSSWGWLNSSPVLIDYGCTNELYDAYFA